MNGHLQVWVRSGKPWIWLNAGMASAAIIMVVGLLLYIAARGMSHFWPDTVIRFDYVGTDGNVSRVLGEVVETETLGAARLKAIGMKPPPGETRVQRVLVRTANRDLAGADFQWFPRHNVRNEEYPQNVLELEREEWGNFIGFPLAIRESGKVVESGSTLTSALAARLQRRAAIRAEIRDIEKDRIGAVNYRLERIRRQERKAEAGGTLDAAARAAFDRERKMLDGQYAALTGQLGRLYEDIKRDSLLMRTVDGTEVDIPFEKIVRAYEPNAMGPFDRLAFFFGKFREFVADDPREANTEGGIYPAIFGTVLMVIIMAVMVTPFGVIAAVYLSEYAKQGPFTRMIRIAVNNLAGVPSVVYGVFGLGFFVYFLGGRIDELFYAEALPAPPSAPRGCCGRP